MTLFFRFSSMLVLLIALFASQTVWAKDTSAAKVEKASISKDLKEPPKDLSPTTLFEKTTREAVNELAHHYSHLVLDNKLSERLLKRYLSHLDPNHIYFLQSDIDKFQKFRDQLDDQIGKGDLEAGYTIFNVYQKRAQQRLTYMLATLKKGIDKLDFKTNETILIDRSEADWAADTKAANNLWRRRLTNYVISMRLDGVKDDEISERLTRRYKNQLKRLHQTTSQDVFQVYINALCSLYDPHTDYFTPEKLASFNIDMSHSLEGIGAVLVNSDGYTKIVRLVPGGPAATSGKLKPGDRIVGVSEGDKDKITNIIGWRLDEVVKLIRGPKGSKVKLQIMPASSASEQNTHDIELTRDKIKLEAQAATSKLLTIKSHGHNFKIGVIELPAFYQDFDAYRRGDPNYTSSYRDVKKLVTKLKKKDIDGLVMDLRNNGGGSLYEAIRLVSLFVDGGPTVQIRDAKGHVSVDNDVYPGTLYQGPMAVLVNHYSASASEIFTGAMQDYGRALIVGDQTFGKGTVQTLLKLNYGDIKLTEAKFYRVSGSSNQLKGIIPDIRLPFVVDKKDIGESAQPNPLPWDHIAAANYTPMFNFGPYLDALVKDHKKRVENDPYFNYVRTMNKMLHENKSRKTLSINQAKRKTLRDKMNDKTLAIENKRRKAEGKDPLPDMDALKKLNDEEDTGQQDKKQTGQGNKNAEKNTEKETDKNASKGGKEDKHDTDKPDHYLDETGKILGDLVYLMKENKLASVNYWQ